MSAEMDRYCFRASRENAPLNKVYRVNVPLLRLNRNVASSVELLCQNL